MGRVYLARTTGAGGFVRHVVLKILDIEGLAESDDRIAMFLDEARAIGRMYHQHIAPVFEVGRGEDGRYFLVLEYIHGHSAAEVWDRTLDLEAALPLDFTITVTLAAAAALHYAHEREIIHRDVSMSNLMLGFDGAIKLIDFGIAKASDASTQTQVGYVKGKIGYLAPEQVSGGTIDRRTDVFALGVVLYELATMTRAFREAGDLETLERVRRADFTPPSRVVENFPHDLEQIITRALAREPADRFPDAAALARELSAFGHRNSFVLGDAAVGEVMAQLFDDRAEPWLRDAAAPGDLDDGTTMPIDTTIDRPRPRSTVPRTDVRRLRAASDIVRMPVEVHTENTPTTIVPPDMPTTIHSAPSVPRPPASYIAARARTIEPVRRRLPARNLRWLGIGAIIAIGGGVGAGILIRAHADEPARALPADAALDARRPDARPADAALDAPPPDARTTVHIHITTNPPDATVLLDGDKLGHTPYDGDAPVSADMHVIKIRRRGYLPQKLDLKLDADVSQDFVLHALP